MLNRARPAGWSLLTLDVTLRRILTYRIGWPGRRNPLQGRYIESGRAAPWQARAVQLPVICEFTVRSAAGFAGTRFVAVILAALTMGLAVPAFCAEPEVDFAKELYPLLEAKHCRACHSPSGVASGTRLHFPESGAPPSSVEAFGLGLATLVDRNDISQSLLLLKPTNTIPHTGGPLIAPDSEAWRLLAQWAEHLASRVAPSEQQPAEPARRPDEPIRRLTHAQYDNTVRDLLQDRTRPARSFPAEDYVDGYTNQASAQAITPALAETYARAAEKLARNAFRYGDETGLLPCAPRGVTDRDCAIAFVREFGGKAFRRPLSDDEVEAFTGLLLQWAAEGDDFLAGAAAAVEAMLQSPHFLFLVPQASESPTKAFESASRLSYALWHTLPDRELLVAAESGQLAAELQIEMHARRMLSDERARAAFDSFFADWMRFDRVRDTVKDRNRFRDFGPEVAQSMTAESLQLFRHLAWSDQDFREFFTAQYTFVDDFLTSVYGMPDPEVPFGKTPYPATSTRGGILGHGTFLAQTGKPVNTSPTERGLFIREHFLCQAIPPPPPGVDASLPPLMLGARPMTIRETMEELHASEEVCASCHKLVDPIGFGFEHFDTIGAYRETESVRVEPTPQQERQGVKASTHSLAINASGYVAGIENSAFGSPREAGRILARSEICQKCIVRQVFRYLYGRSETLHDAELIDHSYNRFERSGFLFRELVLGLVVTEEFLGTDWSN